MPRLCGAATVPEVGLGRRPDRRGRGWCQPRPWVSTGAWTASHPRGVMMMADDMMADDTRADDTREAVAIRLDRAQLLPDRNNALWGLRLRNIAGTLVLARTGDGPVVVFVGNGGPGGLGASAPRRRS